MIDFRSIERKKDQLRELFNSRSVENVVIDDLISVDSIENLLGEIPDQVEAGLRKSRDYIFAKNKYEKSDFSDYGSSLKGLKEDLLSARFRKLVSFITGEDVFVDSDFHGGGLHQGGAGSFLNMHTDFNYHPLKEDWARSLNILIYLNPEWKSEYGGELKLRHKFTGDTYEIAPILNRCVIMFTRDYTLHGYDEISFPLNMYRRSIAAYAYTHCNAQDRNISSTTWYPEGSGFTKSLLGRYWPKLVRIKNHLLGSSTSKN